MKKLNQIIFFLTLSSLISNYSFSLVSITGSKTVKSNYGSGNIALSESRISGFKHYLRKSYMNMKTSKPSRGKYKPVAYFYSKENGEACAAYGLGNGFDETYDIDSIYKSCEKKYGKMYIFAVGRTIVWDNGNDAKRKDRTFKSKDTDQQIEEKLKKLGFIGGTNFVTKKSNLRTSHKKSVSNKKNNTTTGTRSIAMSWDGYDNLILGKLSFKEKNLKGSIKLDLPKNNGECDGEYTFNSNSKSTFVNGVWSLNCANKMSASGTLSWNTKDGSVTGEGKDNHNKSVKFTVGKKG